MQTEAQISMQHAQSLWRDAGIDIGDGTPTPAALSSALAKVREKVRATSGRYIPTSFDPNEATLSVFPRDINWQWTSAVNTIAPHKGAGVMMRLPLFWQMESPLFETCIATGTFIFVNDQGNMPLGAAAISRSSIDVVVTDADDANAFAQHLLLQGLRFPKAWLIVQRTDHITPLSPALIASESSIRQEIHALPGFPIFVQCEHLANTARYHTLTDVMYEFGANITVTGSMDDPLPLMRFHTHLNAQEHGVCQCGKTVLSVQGV